MTTKPTAPGRSTKGDRWKLHDLLDLEYFLHRTGQAENDDVANASTRTDRDIYLTLSRQSQNDDRPPSRRFLIKGWLNARRKHEEGPLPGSVFREIYRIALIGAALLGAGIGIGLALSLLDYRGGEPLNVSVFLGIAVFFQILLLFLLAVLFCLRAATRSLVRGSVLAGLLGRVLARVSLKARQEALKHLNGGKREAVASAAGLFRKHGHVYGSLFFWPVFKVVQTFAVCFNLGLLGATLLRLTGADVAFGWQSTFQVSSEAVFRIVETMALPWRELLPGVPAHPSLAQIKGSHIILKDGIYHLATENLVSWWPFLCLSVFFYGLLPRVLLLAAGAVVQNRLLARLRFDHGDCDALVQRMISPAVHTAGKPPAVSGSETAVADVAVPSPSADVAPETIARVSALVPEEVFDNSEGIEALVQRTLALQVTNRIKIGEDFHQDQAVLDSLASAGGGSRGGVLVLQEAWQPPIQEMLLFLKHLRRRMGDSGRIVVGLIGKPGPDTIFTPVRKEDWSIWKRSIDALSDPYLRVERLLPHGD